MRDRAPLPDPSLCRGMLPAVYHNPQKAYAGEDGAVDGGLRRGRDLVVVAEPAGAAAAVAVEGHLGLRPRSPRAQDDPGPVLRVEVIYRVGPALDGERGAGVDREGARVQDRGSAPEVDDRVSADHQVPDGEVGPVHEQRAARAQGERADGRQFAGDLELAG